MKDQASNGTTQYGSPALSSVSCSAADSTEKPGCLVEYHLEWRKNNSGPWYFGGMLKTTPSAFEALRQERRDAARTGEGVEWRLVEQTIRRRIMEIEPPNISLSIKKDALPE